MALTPNERQQRERAESQFDSVPLGFRVSAADAEVIRANAKALGMTVSKWVASHLEGPIRYARQTIAELKKQHRDCD